MEVFKENLDTGYDLDKENDASLISAFNIFFPAVTGLMAGANMSGDLKSGCFWLG